eukprot:3624198-Alexandrium_andersonii.AAC.1
MDAVAPMHVLIPMLARALAHGTRGFGKCARGPCSGKASRVRCHNGHRGWFQITACPPTHVLFSPPLVGVFSGLAVGQAAAQPARQSRPGVAAMER